MESACLSVAHTGEGFNSEHRRCAPFFAFAYSVTLGMPGESPFA